jgi:uncharacterized membrane protein YfcA
MIDAASIAIVAGAALVGGAVNAVAGGGSLITFPTLVFVGLPAVTANVTNTIAMCPGYLGATFAQRRELAGQGRRAARLLPIVTLCGAGGALLLLATGEGSFNLVVPFLILFAALLVAGQERLRKLLLGRDTGGRARAELWAAVPVGLSAIYGGYFGAGMGVMVLAALGVVLEDSLIRINALKQTISLFVNVAAAIVFVIWGPVDWTIVVVMAVTSLAGGALGGVLASKVPPKVLRWLVVVLGVLVAGVYFVKIWI